MGSEQIGGTYDLSVMDIESQQRVWRAKEEISGTGYGAYTDFDAKNFVATAIQALSRDGMIPSAVTPTKPATGQGGGA